ncbi:MAG: alkaline phosphatase family protein [Bifidobacteriaceae bacterium]|jgi:hypothetical protein|nr:alkaline phosphatase family protein [Bifidobacteriaceae bacterium]
MPRYRGPSLSRVLPAAVARLGIELPAWPPGGGPAGADLTADGPGLVDGPGSVGGPDVADGSGGGAGDPWAGWADASSAGDRPRGIVILLVDGLGLANLGARRGHAPFLAAQPSETLVSGFPSTTVASLGSLGTGLAPGQTALAGYSLRDPATGRRANLIQWDTPTPPRAWQPHATVFERLDAAGRPAGFVGEARFADSPMTQSSLRGARFHPAAKRPAAIVAAALAAARAGDGLLYVYVGALDKIGHAAGWRSAAWAEALEALDAAVRHLVARLGRGWEVWLTADHGQVDVTGAPVWDVAKDPALAEGVDVVAGEARAVHLYGADPAAVAARWRRRLGPAAWVLTRREAVAAGLFGQVDQRVRPYLGDVVAALAGRGTVLDSRVGGGAAKMVGHHGSLTAAEMRVPLIRWRR